jgi:hypothetical protein
MATRPTTHQYPPLRSPGDGPQQATAPAADQDDPRRQQATLPEPREESHSMAPQTTQQETAAPEIPATPQAMWPATPFDSQFQTYSYAPMPASSDNVPQQTQEHNPWQDSGSPQAPVPCTAVMPQLPEPQGAQTLGQHNPTDFPVCSLKPKL